MDEFPCSDTLNEQRHIEEIIRWWNVPFVDELRYEESGEIGVCVLDGATWDGPRLISEHATFDEAVAAANFYVSHSDIWRRFKEPYQPIAKVDHLIDMSSFIHGKLAKMDEKQLFDYMFHWLPNAEPTKQPERESSLVE